MNTLFRNIKALPVFNAVANNLSFTKASKELNVTQPAVTYRIRSLEESLDMQLFYREHNKATLTPAGEILFNLTNKILTLCKTAEDEMIRINGKEVVPKTFNELNATARINAIDEYRNSINKDVIIKELLSMAFDRHGQAIHDGEAS